jgi:branched-chain amino acid aminotransferase
MVAMSPQPKTSAAVSPDPRPAAAPAAMPLKIYISGKLYDKQDAKISVYDHGLLYGDGVFEGMRSYGGKVFRLEEHLTRLYNSAKAIWLTIPLSRDVLAKAVNDTLAANGIADGYIRLVVTRGAGSLGLDPNKTADPQVIIITDHITLYPAEFYEHGLEIVTASTIRNHSAALSPRIKSLNYLNNILAKIEGLQAGCVEALMLNQKGEVAECTGDNIFLVSRGRLLTPPTDAGILEGITRDAVIELALSAGIAVQEIPLTRHDVYVSDECFLTGSAAEVIPVVKVDNRVIGDGKPGSVTRDLTKRFKELTRQ